MAEAMVALKARREQALEDEMVPLPVAATVCYFHVTDAAHQVRTKADLDAIVPLVAIALSTIAPIHGVDGPLGNAELRELLYRDRRPDLARLRIRRGDLRTAMVTLREARAGFSR